MNTLTVGDLTFELRRSHRRRHSEIVVDRDGTLLLMAPSHVPLEALAEMAEERRLWVYRKLAQKDLLRTDPPEKEFVTGEGFLYLGRSYRLLLVDDQEQPLKLEQGRFKLRRSNAADGRRCFTRWYTERGQSWMKRRAALWVRRLDGAVNEVVVRDLGYRWGSCGKDGRLNFHWRTVLLPPDIIDYVIVHELAHLHEPNHTAEFWRRVERAMPDFGERKTWLALNGGEMTGV